MTMRYKDNSNKFINNNGESWKEYITGYQQVALNYGLDSDQKLQYIHNIVGIDAKRYYLDIVQIHVSLFNHAVGLIAKEYNSHVKKARVKN